MKHVLHRHQLTRVLGCWLLAAFSQWASAQSALEDATVVDAIVKQFIAGLAKDQRFTLLTAPNPGDAQPGSLYSVKEPESCPSDLRRATLNGEAVDISRWQDLPPPLGGGESKGSADQINFDPQDDVAHIFCSLHAGFRDLFRNRGRFFSFYASFEAALGAFRAALPTMGVVLP